MAKDIDADLSPTPAGQAPRSTYLDALRGFAIVLVVIGHVIQRGFGIINFFDKVSGDVVIAKTWYTVALLSFGYWHMPLFMGVSGFLTFGHIKTPVGKWLNRKAGLLLVPFLSWILVYYWVPDRFLDKGKSFVEYAWITVRNPGNGLWYLPVLFVFYALTVMVEATGTGEWGFLVVGLGIAALPTTPLVGIDQMQLVWWWFAIGYLVAKYREYLFPWRWYLGAIAVVVYPIALYQLSHWHHNEYLPIVKLAGVAVCMIVVYVAVALVRLGKPLAYLGRRTLDIYVAQFMFTSLALWSGWGRIALVTVVTIAGSLAVTWVLRQQPLLDTLFLGGRHRRGEMLAMPGKKPPAETGASA